jgi:hypothetical protein
MSFWKGCLELASRPSGPLVAGWSEEIVRIAATPRVRNVIIFARRLAKRLSIEGVLFAADEERGEYEFGILCCGIAKE